LEAAEVDEAEEVLDVVLPADDQAPKVVKPGKKAFDPPSSAVSTQWAPVLGNAAVAAVGRDHFDAVSIFKFGIQLVGVIGLVADQPLRQFV
jgi:hypothetical protein